MVTVNSYFVVAIHVASCILMAMKPRAQFYLDIRRQIGGREYVAKLLKVNWTTLWRRETRQVPITEEMMLALMMLKSNHKDK